MKLTRSNTTWPLRSALICGLIVMLNLPLHLSAARSGDEGLALLNSTSSQQQISDARTALVIGNSAYFRTSFLSTPANDAADMKSALEGLGFEVVGGSDMDRESMIRAIWLFGNKLKARGGTGLFYYAGHGLQSGGKNFLIPVDASISSETEVAEQGVEIARVLEQMLAAGNSFNMIILDAGRGNPFSNNFSARREGLARIDTPPGTVVLYSTAPGTTVTDTVGSRNAPYTAALLNALKLPARPLSELFLQVRTEVRNATGKRQVPWESSSGQETFEFSKPAEVAVARPTPITSNPPPITSNPPKPAEEISRGPLPVETPKQSPRTVTGLVVPPTGTVDRSAVPIGSMRSNSLGMEFVYVPPGEFMIGSSDGDRDERPVSQVRIKDGFWMGRFEVTQGQWRSLMGNNPSYFQACGDNCPVEKISWTDAQAFIARLNARNDGFIYSLPTEAQWEYAARAGTTTVFAFGDVLRTDQANFNGKKQFANAPTGPFLQTTVRVGSYKPNAWGLYDMHGNVWEWVEDLYSDDGYEELNKDGSANVTRGSSGHRVLRGGSWFDGAFFARSSNRLKFGVGSRFDYIGFRVVARPSQ